MLRTKLVNGFKVSGILLRKMSGLPLPDVVKALNEFADVSLAASWDNVGLLIEPSTPKDVSRILLTNDLTENVMEEAIVDKTDLIISYHPPIFAPMKRITTQTWKERIVLRCIEHKIALYSPHTSFDSVKGGVNDWLAGAFDCESCEPIEPSSTNSSFGMGRICTLKSSISIDNAIKCVKKQTGVHHVQLASARPAADSIHSVAICAGSGASVLAKVKADLFVTGEMSHHEVLDAVHRGTSVILTNHSNSERGFLKDFQKILQASLKSVEVCVSDEDRDPLDTKV